MIEGSNYLVFSVTPHNLETGKNLIGMKFFFNRKYNFSRRLTLIELSIFSIGNPIPMWHGKYIQGLMK